MSWKVIDISNYNLLSQRYFLISDISFYCHFEAEIYADVSITWGITHNYPQQNTPWLCQFEMELMEYVFNT